MVRMLSCRMCGACEVAEVPWLSGNGRHLARTSLLKGLMARTLGAAVLTDLTTQPVVRLEESQTALV